MTEVFLVAAFGAALSARTQQLGQTDAGHAGDAELQETAAIQAVAVAGRATEVESKHGGYLGKVRGGSRRLPRRRAGSIITTWSPRRQRIRYSFHLDGQ